MTHYSYEFCVWLKEHGFPQEDWQFAFCKAGPRGSDALWISYDRFLFEAVDGEPLWQLKDILCACPSAEGVLEWTLNTRRREYDDLRIEYDYDRQEWRLGFFIWVQVDEWFVGPTFPAAVEALTYKIKGDER